MALCEQMILPVSKRAMDMGKMHNINHIELPTKGPIMVSTWDRGQVWESFPPIRAEVNNAEWLLENAHSSWPTSLYLPRTGPRSAPGTVQSKPDLSGTQPFGQVKTALESLALGVSWLWFFSLLVSLSPVNVLPPQPHPHTCLRSLESSLSFRSHDTHFCTYDNYYLPLLEMLKKFQSLY